jgi:hypothetical protein
MADTRFFTFTDGTNRSTIRMVTTSTARCRSVCIGEAYLNRGGAAVAGQSAVSGPLSGKFGAVRAW